MGRTRKGVTPVSAKVKQTRRERDAAKAREEERRYEEAAGSPAPPDGQDEAAGGFDAAMMLMCGKPTEIRYYTPRDHKEYKPFNKARQEAFLAELARTGQVMLSAQKVDVCPGTVTALRDKDPDFNARYLQAKQGIGETLEAFALDHALNGIVEPQFGGKDGALVGYKRVYDHGLLQALLRANNPKFAPAMKLDHSVTGGGVLAAPVYDARSNWREVLKQSQGKLQQTAADLEKKL